MAELTREEAMSGGGFEVVEVHRSGVRVCVWNGRSGDKAQAVCDRLNRRRSGGLDGRYPFHYEVCDVASPASTPPDGGE